MPKASPIYSSFTAGELTPLLAGQTNLDQYYRGGKQAKNLLITQYGPILSRTGTEYVAEVKTSAKATRIIQCRSSSLGDYIIEMGNAYMRFFDSDGFIIGSEIVSPFLEAQLFDVQYDEQGETMTLTHENHKPQLLTRTGAGTWTIGDYAFVGNPYQLDNTSSQLMYIENSLNTPTGNVVNQSLTIEAPFDVVYSGQMIKIGVPTGSPEKQGFVQVAGLNDHRFTSTTGVSLTLSATTGSVTVTAGAAHFEASMVGETIVAYDGNHNPSTVLGRLTIDSYVDTTHVTGTVTITFSTTSYIAERWAVSSPKVFSALVKSVLSTGVGTTTTEWADAQWSDSRGWPSRCAYVDRHLYLARTSTKKTGYWRSKPFIYDDFEPGTGLDDDGISEELPESNDINWLFGGRRLVIGTDVGDFSVSGTGGSSPTAGDLDAKRQTNWGSEPIVPERVGSFGYYVQEKGRKLRELTYSFQEDAYKAPDMTVVSEHITKSGIKDTSYQRNPYSILYCVLNNGKIAAMTREADQEALGWTPLDTDGLFESVATIRHPTEDYDITYVIVNRTINGATKRYIERFEDPQIPDRQDMNFYLDCGLRYNAYNDVTGGALTLSGTTGTVTATAGSAVFASGDVGRRIRAIDADGNLLGELEITVFTNSTNVDGTVTQTFSTTSYAQALWGLSVTSISGLTHLEAESVKILADGAPVTDKTVSSGAITLDASAFVVAVGLGYTSRWENMAIESGSATGTSQGKLKRIYQCGFKFFKSLGMKVGSDSNHLKDLPLDTTTVNGVEQVFTGLVPPVPLDFTFENEGHVVIEQSKPLPMCIVAVLPLLETNDK